jgi:hypothetical protein
VIHVFPNILIASDACLTPSAVVLLWVSSDLSREEREKAAYERQVARRWTEHWDGLESEMERRQRNECWDLSSVCHVKMIVCG